MLCSHCGAQFSPGVNAACRDCRLAPHERAEPSLADDDDGPDEVGFDLADWPAEDRVGIGVTLNGDGVPFRWEEGPMLVVRESDEDAVEALLDSLADDEDGGWEDVDEDDEDEDDDDDGGALETVMGDLFDVSDRLIHAPWNREFVEEVRQLITVVESSEPPFGIVPEMWDQVANLASAVVAGADDQDDVAVEDAATTLRSYLREYV
ncbi:MAG: hypothetical protein ACRD2W_04780 [Acidimicrobiales bacterium]